MGESGRYERWIAKPDGCCESSALCDMIDSIENNGYISGFYYQSNKGQAKIICKSEKGVRGGSKVKKTRRREE